MAIRLLVISGSPTDGSSTDLLLKRLSNEVIERLESTADVEAKFVKLNHRAILPCQACGEAPTPKWCFYDEINDLFRLLAETDCLLFGSPVFFDSVSAQAKLFIDRCNCFRPADFKDANPEHSFIKLIKRKRPGAMVLVGGKEGWFEGARRCIAGYFKWIEVVNEGVVSYRSPDFNEKGTAMMDAAVLSQVGELAEKLADRLAQGSGERGLQ
jgi:multimeric flavodoxin WrbA